MEVRICPDCGRPKAGNWEDVKNGLCPKWYAITDKQAEIDCQNYAPLGEQSLALQLIIEANSDVRLRLPGSDQTIAFHEFIASLADMGNALIDWMDGAKN